MKFFQIVCAGSGFIEKCVVEMFFKKIGVGEVFFKKKRVGEVQMKKMSNFRIGVC